MRKVGHQRASQPIQCRCDTGLKMCDVSFKQNELQDREKNKIK